MAAGDKIFIADKPTLDLVNDKIDQLGTGVEDIKSNTSNIRGITELLTEQVNPALLNVMSNTVDSHTVAQLSKFRNFTGNSTVGSNYVNVLSITGSGKLHYAILQCRNSTSVDIYNNTYIQIIVDGVTVHTGASSLNNVGSAHYIGYAAGSSIVGNYDGAAMLFSGRYLNVNRGSIPMTNNPTNYPCALSLLPLRWSTSLVIRAYTTHVSSPIEIYYELD